MLQVERQYFFDLVNKIRTTQVKNLVVQKKDQNLIVYKDYEMDIDLDTGKIDIKTN